MGFGSGIWTGLEPIHNGGNMNKGLSSQVLRSSQHRFDNKWHPIYYALITFISTMLFISWSWFPLSVMGETVKKDAKTTRTELHNMTNEELLNEARTLLTETNAKFLAQLRGLHGNEIQIKETRQKTESLQTPQKEPPVPPEDMVDPVEAAKDATGHASVRLKAFNRRLELIRTEKALWEKKIELSEAAKSAANALADAIERLKLFTVEIQWRVDDGTLSPEQFPTLLGRKRMEIQKRNLILEQQELERRIEAAHDELNKVVSRIEEAQEAVIEAEVDHNSAKRKHDQELKRQTLEKEYSGQTPQRLLARIPELQEERVWLKGAFDLTRSRFENRRGNRGVIQTALDELKPREALETLQPSVLHPEAMKEAAQVAENMVAYCSQRIKTLKALLSALQALIQDGESFQGDATVLSDHLFRIQVVAKILQGFTNEGKIEAGSIPADSLPEAIMADRDAVSKLVSHSLTVTRKAKKEIPRIREEIQISETAQKETKEKLGHLKEAYASAQQAQKWASGLKDLTAMEIVEDFQESKEALKKHELALQKTLEELKQERETVKEARQRFESLKDPLLRLAQQESLEKKQDILKTLYTFAGLELPAQLRPATDAKAASSKTKGAMKGSRKDASPFEIEDYQNLLSSRSRVMEGQKKHRLEIADALKALDARLSRRAALLTETSKSAQQQYANAAEMKKRLGRGQIKAADLPDGITHALKRELISKIEMELSELQNEQIRIRQEMESLVQRDESLHEMQSMFAHALSLVGKRHDLLQSLKKLDQGLERNRTALSETQLKSLKQTATRRLRSHETPKESLLGIVPSERDENLTDLLEAFYVELIELEGKQENLQDQINETERLIQFAEEEKTVISKLLPFLHNQLKQLKIQEEEGLAKTKISLLPQKAEELLSQFETRTGRRFPILPPFPEEKRADAIEAAAQVLFDRHVQIVAAEKWITLFEQRLSSSGVNVEIGDYQDRMGGLNATRSSMERQIQHLVGQPQPATEERLPQEEVRTKADKGSFGGGKIGVLRAERYQIRTQTAILVVGKLVGLIIITLFLIWLINHLVGRAIRREQEKEDRNTRSIRVYALLRTSLKFLVVTVAVILFLHSLGFNIGAILAGLGIGGFAIAIASKETLGNLIGGINILITKPFKMGDYVMFEDKWCAIEDIGLRYTKLRERKSQHLLIAPNAKLSENTVINTNADHRRLRKDLMVPLSIRNSFEQVGLAMKLVHELLEDYPDATPVFVLPGKFDDYSIVLHVRYDVHEVDKWSKAFHDIHLEIIKRFEEHNVELAARPYITV